jgi:hypothetical protein
LMPLPLMPHYWLLLITPLLFTLIH